MNLAKSPSFILSVYFLGQIIKCIASKAKHRCHCQQASRLLSHPQSPVSPALRFATALGGAALATALGGAALASLLTVQQLLCNIFKSCITFT